ncbi:LysR family transcriptional regulator [Streptomyces sp. NPDC007971]|uniref:LysR family transcriptional regulator n=1 Tax=Streptomyces sp. NPDC007971 TaxID=3364799 RepID=UPI0036E2C248
MPYSAHALLEERHVSRAAVRLRMSQPSMSRALQRLRATLGDELLMRGPGGYQLTPRAERIQAELQHALPRLEHVFSGETFDPATAAHAFRLAGTDYTVSVLSGALLGRVFEQSPGSTVLFSRWHRAVFAEAGEPVADAGASSGPSRIRGSGVSMPVSEDRGSGTDDGRQRSWSYRRRRCRHPEEFRPGIAAHAEFPGGTG